MLLVLSCSPFSSATCLKTHSLTFRGLRQLRFQLVTLTFPYYTYPDSGLHKGNFLDLFNADGWKFHHHIASTCMTSSFSLWLPVDRIQLDGGVSKINALLGVRTHKIKCYQTSLIHTHRKSNSMFLIRVHCTGSLSRWTNGYHSLLLADFYRMVICGSWRSVFASEQSFFRFWGLNNQLFSANLTFFGPSIVASLGRSCGLSFV